MKWICTLLVCAGFLAGCQQTQPTLKIAASAMPHAEILEWVKPKLNEQGIELTIIVVDDYNTPNRALADHDVDLNFFQHLPFLEQQQRDFGYALEPLVAVHIEPMGIYSRRYKSLGELKDGSTVALPADPANQARALLLLEREGLITLKDRSIHASLQSIDRNPKHLTFHDVDSALLTRTLEDVDAAAITTNYALQAGLNPLKDALVMEQGDSPFANWVVIRQGDAVRPEIQAFKEVLASPELKDFILQKYQGAILPIR